MATIFTHNGTFTVTSNKTGSHRTFQVRTQKPDAKFAPGSRIISMLTGPDNHADYTGFGFVNDNGKIYLWAKKQTPTFRAYATMLENMAGHVQAGNIVVQAATKCRKCNRKLTDPISIETGIGPICAGK
jgi:hypothetical protein